MKIGSFRSLLSLLVCALPALACAKPKEQELPILVYHQISVTATQSTDAPTLVSLKKFEEQMRYLHDNGYTTLSMDEVAQFLHGHPFHGKIVAITFDDGWASELSAVPVLKQYGFKATFFIIGNRPDGGNNRYMGWDKVKSLAANPLFSVQSHTMTHPWEPGNTLIDWLKGTHPIKAREHAVWELTESKRLLEEKIKKPVSYLAWPCGIYNDELVKMAENAGYKALLTVDDGMNHPHEDPLHISRAPVDGRCDFETFKNGILQGHSKDCSPVNQAKP